MAKLEPVKTESELSQFIEVGVSGLKRFSGYVQDEWHKDLRGTKAVKVYREMVDNHPIIGAADLLFRLLMGQVVFTIEKNKSGDSPLHEQARLVIEQAFDDVDGGVKGILSEAMSFTTYGWAYLEKVFKLRKGDSPFDEMKSKYSDGLWGWRKIALRSQDSLLRWEFGEHGEILGMWQLAPPRYKMTFIPIEKAILFRLFADRGNPEGRSLYRPAYTSYYMQKHMIFIEGVGYERNLAGMPHMQVPAAILHAQAGSAQANIRSAYEDMVQRIKTDELFGLLTPSETGPDGKPTGYKFGLVNSGGRALTDTNVPITRHNQMIALTLMVEFMLLGSMPNGSYSLSSDKTDMVALCVGALIDKLIETLQESVVELNKMNGFPQEVCPTISRGDIEAPDLQSLATYVSSLIGAGAMIPDKKLEEHLRSLYHLPKPDAASERMPEIPEQPHAITLKPNAPTPNNGGDVAPQADIQATALNGAQVSSLIETINSVATGQLPRDSAIRIIAMAFQIDESEANRIMGDVGIKFFADQNT